MTEPIHQRPDAIVIRPNVNHMMFGIDITASEIPIHPALDFLPMETPGQMPDLPLHLQGLRLIEQLGINRLRPKWKFDKALHEFL
jgi:hypothetical protein